MRCAFADDPELKQKLFNLLDRVFPGLRETARIAADMGAAPWETVSTPFLEFEGDRIVAHVGLIPVTLVLDGQAVTVGSIHAVATDPACRGRGLFRKLTQEALEYSRARYETLILTTEHPEYYTPFGFRHVVEHEFNVQEAGKGARVPSRPIDTGEAGDLALLKRLLETREPVSQLAGVINERAIFYFNECRRPIRYFENCDVAACMELGSGSTLKLYDIVGPRIPPLDELLSGLGQSVERVSIYFSPDRLRTNATAVPHLLDHDGPSYLMVRGPFAPEGRPFCLPRSVRT